MKRARRRQESGYALLLVFLMAAMIAISLYIEIPRVAFESQRQKEQLLVERGEQYKRAIYMFQKANKRWPATIDELESFNNRRFLRKRFIDPMTGKEEWRIIHIVGNILTDSLVQKPKTQQAEASSQSQLVGEIPLSAADTTQGQQSIPNPAMRRRSSDGIMPGMGGNAGGQPVDPNNPNYPNNPANPQNPVYPGQPYPGQAYPGQPYPGQPSEGTSVQPGQSYAPGTLPPGVPIMPGQPGANQPYPGQPQYPGQMQQYPGQTQPYPGQPVNTQFGGVSPYQTGAGANGAPPQYGQPGLDPSQQGVQSPIYPGQPNPGMPGQPYGQGTFPPGMPGMPGQPNTQNSAQGMIQQILTSPRPGGMPTGLGGQVVGGGIAGVASKADAEGIMVYHDRTNYKEWEFIFDPAKVKLVPNPLTGSPGTSAASMGSMPGTSAASMGSMPGSVPGQTGSPGLGSPGFGSPGFGSPGFGGSATPPTTGVPPTQPQQ